MSIQTLPSIFNDIESSSSSSGINIPNDMASMNPPFPAVTKEFCLSKIQTLMSVFGTYTLTTPVTPVNTKLLAHLRALLDPILAEHPEWLSASTYKALLGAAESATEKCYTKHPFETKLYIAVQIFFFYYIDDGIERQASQLVPDLPNLWYRLLTPGPMNMANPWLAFLFAYMHKETTLHYGDYMAATSLTSIMEWISGNLLERTFPDGFPNAKPVDFPRWFRRKNGNAECFMAFLFPKVLFPDETLVLEKVLPAMNGMVDLADCANDILSFYKESVVGDEVNTHFANEAKVRGVGIEVVLEDWCGKVVDTWAVTIDQLGDGLEGELYAGIVRGNFMFHISCPRYRLAELGLKHTEAA